MGSELDIDQQVALYEENSSNYKLIMRISSVFTVFSTIMSIYLIVMKSPDAIKHYKLFLLNIAVSKV